MNSSKITAQGQSQGYAISESMCFFLGKEKQKDIT